MNVYSVNVTRVIDADTFVGDMELELGVALLRQRFRLHTVNMPEQGTEEGQLATELLTSVIEKNGHQLWVTVHGRDKYGRIIVEPYLDSLCSQPLSTALVAEWLRRQGSDS